jgi:hypothetical protein
MVKPAMRWGNLHASQPGKVPGRLTMNYIYLFPGEQLSLGQICISYDRTLNDWGFVLHLGHYTSINYWKRDLYGAREASAGPEAVHLVTSSAICDGIFAFGDRNKDELEIEIRIGGAARGFRWKIRLRRCNGASAELRLATSIVNLACYIIHPISFQIPLSYLIKLISSLHL